MLTTSHRFYRPLLRLCSLLIGCATFVAGLFALTAVLMPVNIKSTIQNSSEILETFKIADREVLRFREGSGSFPDTSTLNRLLDREGHGSYFVIVIDPSLNDFTICCEEGVRTLGTPPSNSYMLQAWGGEWSEYYASWSGKNTLIFDPDAYSATGNLYLDAVVACMITLAFAVGTVRLWKASRSEDRADY